ncbi:MAG: tRNA (adenosine(37)-N6)-threonylcarbamoyltransferase complex transferase subunit TsaD [Deltaproteobacteria bacterium]|nr:tRNA (adenosine(37)-N6)-threonylcarbamoyltransferase complex transferase subunit TsaD [Deltaproteobacteria bacterium]
MLILGIETSCDDTAASILDNDRILSNVLSSQDTIHTKFGGVVPELASRSHLQSIYPIVKESLVRAKLCLADIELISVTQGPGLMGSLLVGFSFAKAISQVSNIPLVGVDHMAGHILSIFLEDHKPPFPFIALVVSGGTSSIYLAENFTTFSLLGRTRDDAAGEAFDKVAKLLHLPYPGGPHVSRKALAGNPEAIRFPRAWLEAESLDFSFSGLKTSVMNHYNHKIQQEQELQLQDICASFQEAVVDVLIGKTTLAAEKHGVNTIVLGGGVSSNQRLREKLEQRCRKKEISFFVPRPEYCTDNGAMIALAGYYKFNESGKTSLCDDVYSRSQLG